MATNKSPAFQFYTRDFMSCDKVMLMSNQEVGGYIMLLCQCWNRGSLPIDEDELALYARMTPSVWAESRDRIMVCFVRSKKGWEHKRLKAEKKKQKENSKARSKSARIGVQMRKAAKDSGLDARKRPTFADGLLEQNPALHTSTSTSSSTTKDIPPISPKGEPRIRFKPPTQTDIDEFCVGTVFLSRFGSDFIDFYESKGWMVGKSKMKDWKAAYRRWSRNNLPKGSSTGKVRL